jgi:hypothetical protein
MDVDLVLIARRASVPLLFMGLSDLPIVLWDDPAG